LSNVIKSAFYKPANDKKLIEHAAILMPESFEGEPIDPEEAARRAQEDKQIAEASQIRDQIIQDAEMFAEEQIRQALDEATVARESAQQQINAWWEERRSEDEQLVLESRDNGYQLGYQEGLAKAEAEVSAKYEAMLLEASNVLQQSHQIKDQIIHESEPFLIELSSSIAEKIIGKQLTLTPEWTVELVRKVLSRRKEKGVIALCVSPKHFDYIFNAREELATSIDSQAELQILPDATVQDEGCVIRSAFGSIDARIDTQLREIKSVLLQIAASGEREDE